MTARYRDEEMIKLEDFMSPTAFRTIPRKFVDVPLGISERKVIVEIKSSFSKEIKMKIPSHGRIHGAIKMNEKLAELDRGDSAERYGNKIKEIYLCELDDNFRLVIVYKDSNEKSFLVSKSDVKFLLDICTKYPDYVLDIE